VWVRARAVSPYFLFCRRSEVNTRIQAYLRLHAHKSLQQTKLADMKYFASGYGTIVCYILVCMKVKLIFLLRQKHHEDVKGVQR
jgi:hypothetical protein